MAILVAVSIFVNPLQFGPDEDYARYPRPLDDDLEVCEADGVDRRLRAECHGPLPARPAGHPSTLARLARCWKGALRPGHFDGVLTVVLKLFNIVRPDVAIFGEKDAQQLACIQRMVTDLNFPSRDRGRTDRP